MNDQPQLTPLQLDVLQILWRDGEASVNDVTEGLRPNRGLAPTTVATLLSRLEKRRVVERRREGRQFVYRALIDREEARRTLVDELTRSLFAGDAGGLIHHLVERGEVAAGDLERAKNLLEGRENEA